MSSSKAEKFGEWAYPESSSNPDNLFEAAALAFVVFAALSSLTVARNESLPDSQEDWEDANFGRMGSGVAGGGCLGEMP